MNTNKTTIYGIKNCDTMKKAMKWLDSNSVDYAFHDYKKSGLDKKTLQTWCKQVDWETLVNRRGTTWRKLPDDVKESVNKKSAIELMIENPSLVKRPVLVAGDNLLVGFDEDSYGQLLVT